MGRKSIRGLMGEGLDNDFDFDFDLVMVYLLRLRAFF